MSDTIRLADAALESKLARERFLATAQELKARLDPATIIDDAVDGAKAGAAELVENATHAARRRPAVAIGIAATAALLVLRRPIGRLFRGKSKDRDATGYRRRR